MNSIKTRLILFIYNNVIKRIFWVESRYSILVLFRLHELI
nr:MAG TPA_asm: hypothetical protein [Caudoviricetes sp.]